MRLGICLFAGISAQFFDEKFGTLCHATVDDMSALDGLNETEKNEIKDIAFGVAFVKETIRRLEEDVNIAGLLFSSNFSDATYLDTITIAKFILFKWDNDWCKSGIEVFSTERESIELDVAAIRKFIFDIFAEVSESSTREIEDMITSVAAFLLTEVEGESANNVFEYILQPLAPFFNNGSSELPVFSPYPDSQGLTLTETNIPLKKRSTVPRSYANEICSGVNDAVKQFSRAIKPPIEKFHAFYLKYFSGNFTKIDSIGSDVGTAWAFVRLVALYPEACDGCRAHAEQVIPMLQNIMTFENTIGHPEEQTFYTGVLRWFIYSARFNLMLKEYIPFVQKHAKKNYFFGAIWGGFEDSFDGNLLEQAKELDRSARSIEANLFCDAPNNKTQCEEQLEEIWERNGLPLNRDSSASSASISMAFACEMINQRYKAIRELKESRDGKIYFLVEDTQNDNELKMLKGIALLNEQQEEDAKSEVALLQKLDNDYVVKLLDDFVFNGPKNFTYHALILEYLPGGDLSEYLKEKLLNEGKETEEPWDENEALRITAQLAVALDYVHSQNVIHRDVKPENVLLSADKKTAKLADFNISRTIEATKNTGVAGTIDYYPPETLKNQETEQISFRRDLWPFGIIMQMLCTFRDSFTKF
ncbi:Oidioi.mRNA.OKI2018_I69.chr2.g8398.t1.cds [Oikopleura dioica]|uniref:non-specific serine/threonine protein kinase n=1 Tax=Oikopleura dioica TaxID=34765 RepID=A0ABN7TA18_OIKDI|nr:Oidioi.mRNA.OKI2018_I69.chr2.g8398.t1.cds [Oikopleura dioica]